VPVSVVEMPDLILVFGFSNSFLLDFGCKVALNGIKILSMLIKSFKESILVLDGP